MQFVDGVRRPQAGSVMIDSRPQIWPEPMLPPRKIMSMDGVRRPMPMMTPALARPLPTMTPILQQTAVASIQSFAPGFAFPLKPFAIGFASLALVSTATLGATRIIAQRTSPAAVVTAPVAQVEPFKSVSNPEAEAVAVAAAASSAQLKSLVDSFAASAGAPVGIFVKDLKTQSTASANVDKQFTSASLYKLFVANAIYKSVDTGGLRLGDTVRGTGSSIAECLNAMITVSDNTCGVALGNIIGWEKYNATLKNQGFSNTKFGSPILTTASDVGLLYERLYNGTLLSPNSSQHFLDLLKAQRVNNRLPQGLPAGTIFAHKTGDLEGFVHDAGIVYGPKTDYLVVMTSGPWPSTSLAPTKFAELSRQLYQQLEQ